MKAKTNRIGLTVYCKRNGLHGIVIAEDEDAGTLTVDVQGSVKAITEATFKRWYSIIPQDLPVETEQLAEEVVPPKEAELAVPTPKAEILPAGEVGIGLILRDKFVAILKEFGVEGIEIFVSDEKRTDTIKLNNSNIFECTYAKRRFNVLAHPDSLTPDNKKRAEKMFPKEWGWALRAKFVFTDLSDSPLMKSIIADGLYYRKGGQE